MSIHTFEGWQGCFAKESEIHVRALVVLVEKPTVVRGLPHD